MFSWTRSGSLVSGQIAVQSVGAAEVIVMPPRYQNRPQVLQRNKPVSAQALITQSFAEGVDHAALGTLAVAGESEPEVELGNTIR
jgi:hypothetical protein